MWERNLEGIHRRLHQIRDLAQKIKEVPNFGPDIWSMRKLDRDAAEIRKHCLWIGERLAFPDCPFHHRLVMNARERIRRSFSAARDIEDVPNFGPDLWTMKEVDRKCDEIIANSLWIEERIFDVF